MTKTQHPLVGWTFLSCTRKPGETSGPTECHWQGEIRTVVPTNTAQGDCALVDFFSWWDGSHTYSQLLPLTEFTRSQDSDRFFKLFPTKSEREEYYDRVYGAAIRRQREAELEAAKKAHREAVKAPVPA